MMRLRKKSFTKPGPKCFSDELLKIDFLTDVFLKQGDSRLEVLGGSCPRTAANSAVDSTVTCV